MDNIYCEPWLNCIFRICALSLQDYFKFTILNSVIVTRNSDLMELVNSEARIMLLYCTADEASRILAAAEELKITGKLLAVIVVAID